jgi:hypothetical protein
MTVGMCEWCNSIIYVRYYEILLLLSWFRGDHRWCLDWWMDLLTTYTHDSELQALTTLSLISTIHGSPQHPISLFPACCVIPCHCLVTAFNSGNSSTSVVMLFCPLVNTPQPNCQLNCSAIFSEPPLQNSTLNSQTGGHFTPTGCHLVTGL